VARTIPIPDGGFRNIAVLRLSSLGDVILTLPVIEALKRAFPASRIAYWVKEEYRDVVRHHPGVDHVRVLEKDARKLEDLLSMSSELEDCDLIVDLHEQIRTRILTFRQKAPVLRKPGYRLLRERWVRARWTRPRPTPPMIERYAEALRPIGVAVTGTPRAHVADEEERWAAEWLAGWDGGGNDRASIAMCPGARHFTKRWPEAHWIALHERLRSEGSSLLYFSLDAERRAMPALAARVESDAGARWVTESLGRIAALMSRCTRAVTSDSGLMHLAAARGCRVVALFGSTVPELGFAPAGEGHTVLCRHEPCQPCTLHGREACPLKHFRCMVELKPEEVVVSLSS
jgi:heptosyltransferase II